MDDNFQWPESPDRDWWLRTSMSLGGGERHAKFAAARFRGCSATQAARESGFGGTPMGMRSEGSRVSKTARVLQLIALAQAETRGAGSADTLTLAESKKILTDLARGSDPNVRLKSIDAMTKLTAAEREDRRSSEELDPHQEPEILARRLLSTCPPDRVAPMWSEFVLPQFAWHAPWLRPMAAFMSANHPEQWAGVSRAYLLGEYNQMEHDISRLEKGEVLPLDELLQKCGIERYAEKPKGRPVIEPEESHAAA